MSEIDTDDDDDGLHIYTHRFDVTQLANEGIIDD